MGKRIGALGLVNYTTHPTNKQYKVYSFEQMAKADLFEKGLIEGKLWYERDEEEHQGEILHLFAVRDQDFERVQRVNFMVSAATRKNIIPNAFLRYLLLFFVFGAIIFALIGYVKG
ncbi:hypothetical protein [Crocinitomix algicola]|uniref:hypothetical protein n=1 Tax=Crocinitomix algicola TaxID=1740263 RepID=UPI000832D27F|nr:hypothetical protein [Crocinitomix algicola]